MNIDDLIEGLKSEDDYDHPVNRELREEMERVENFMYVIEMCLHLAQNEYEMAGDIIGNIIHHDKEKNDEYYEWLDVREEMEGLLKKLKKAQAKGCL